MKVVMVSLLHRVANMSLQQTDTGTNNVSVTSLIDLLRMESSLSWSPCTSPSSWSHCKKETKEDFPSPRRRLEKFMSESGNRHCADCGSRDPKWVSLNLGVFICIKCSGIHRSLGVHISKVLSVKLDEWTTEQVDVFIEMGGNDVVNMKYEACLPENYQKPKSDASIEKRSDFIRRKYEMQQFVNSDIPINWAVPSVPSPPPSPSKYISGPLPGKSKYEKQTNSLRIQHLGHAFRYSWRRKEPECRAIKKSNSMAGMVEFIGLVKVNVVRGTNLAVRDVVSSDPYVILSLGNQVMKTRVVKNNLNPVWNEKIMLSIPESIPPLKLLVYDKDTFKYDDFMGDGEIDIQPLVTAAKASEHSALYEPMQLGKWVASKENTLVRDGIITLEKGKVKQDIALRLQNVERGVLELELECVPLTQ